MRIGFTSDLHGRASHFEQLDAWVASAQLDLLILGGDMNPDGDPADPLGTQSRFVRSEFRDRLRAWLDRAPGLAVATIIGNHDWACTRDALAELEQARLLTLLEPQRAWSHRGLNFVGYSCSPPTPFWLKDFERLDVAGDRAIDGEALVWDAAASAPCRVEPADYFRAQPTMRDELQRIATPPAPWIFVCHCPPFDTALDRLPQIEFPIGSRAVREFILQRRPALALHGHAHESPEMTARYHESLDGVLCVNPGQGEQRLHAVAFESESPADTMRHTVFA